MPVNRILDLYAASVTQNTEKALTNRLDSSVDSLKSTDEIRRTLRGIMGSTGNTGYLVFRLDQLPVVTIDMATLNAALAPIEVEIEVPPGRELTVGALSTSGTGAVAVSLLYEESGG